MTLYKENGIVFDAGPIISLTLSGLLWTLEGLKQSYSGPFVITPAVKKEIVDQPISTRKYKFESIRVLPYFANGTFMLNTDERISQRTDEFCERANKIFYADNKPITIIHRGEGEAIAACLELGAKTLVIDERTTRYLIEAPQKIKKRLGRKLKKHIEVDKKMLDVVSKELKEIQPIRSIELVTIAFERKQLNFYEYSNIDKLKDFKKTILEGALWALKTNGCAVIDDEIKDIIKLEKV